MTKRAGRAAFASRGRSGGLARRQLLLALGAACLPRRAWADLAPDAPSVESNAPAVAKRFIGVYMPRGRARELFLPGAGFELRYEHAILAPFDDAVHYGRSLRDRLLVIDELDLAAGFLTGNVGHDAPRVLFTGSGSEGRNASVDQFLAVAALRRRDSWDRCGRDTTY